MRKQDHKVYQMRPNVGPRFSVGPKFQSGQQPESKKPKCPKFDLFRHYYYHPRDPADLRINQLEKLEAAKAA